MTLTTDRETRPLPPSHDLVSEVTSGPHAAVVGVTTTAVTTTAVTTTAVTTTAVTTTAVTTTAAGDSGLAFITGGTGNNGGGCENCMAPCSC